jgi:hypothetical protein
VVAADAPSVWRRKEELDFPSRAGLALVEHALAAQALVAQAGLVLVLLRLLWAVLLVAMSPLPALSLEALPWSTDGLKMQLSFLLVHR